jgi:predicted N-acetyltransferase YhbS
MNFLRMKICQLTRNEIHMIGQIDRSEVIEHIYYLRDGNLVLEPEYYDMHGWPPGEPDTLIPGFLECFDRGGSFWGAFEEDRLVGIAVLENKFIGSARDTLQMKFLQISRDFRKQGLGRELFWLTAQKALELGAKKMYVSATPSENTVNFYMRLGCIPATEIDEELFQLEPEDIHLEFDLERFREKIA